MVDIYIPYGVQMNGSNNFRMAFLILVLGVKNFGNHSKTVLLYFRRCQCNPGWTGDHCQIPEETECEDQIDNDKSK